MREPKTKAEQSLIAQVADEVDAELGIRERSKIWAPFAWRSELSTAWPTLYIDDISGIPFLQDVIGVELYQLRAAVRASDGDLVASTCAPLHDYQAYNRDHLQFGDPELIHAPAVATAAEVTIACFEGAAFARLVDVARASGGLRFHPYMGIEPGWRLAQTIAAEAKVPVHVLGPPPPVTWLANDKQHLTEVAKRAAGDASVVPTHIGHTAEELCVHLRALAQKHPVVALKKTRCASAMGNRTFLSADIHSFDEATLLAKVQQFLSDKEWEGEPVLALVWEKTTSSPSTQMWIPHPDDGPPRLDGIYEQLLEGVEQVFLGSVPLRLSPDVEARLAFLSMQVAGVYQELGYVGRCSFDFIVCEDGRVCFVECNGRWGGTSTPMHLMDRLFPSGRPAYRAQDFIHPELVGLGFGALAEMFGDTLYDARTGEGQYILYNMGMLEQYGKFDVIALGKDVDDASQKLEEQLPRVLGLV